MVVDAAHAGPCQRLVVVAAEQALAGRVERPAAGKGERIGVVVVRVVEGARCSEVLPEGPALVELVLELPAEGLALGVVAIARFADEAAGRQRTVDVRQDGALPREELRGAAGLVLLPQGLQRQRGRGAGAPGERRHDERAVVRYVIDLRVGLSLKRHQAVRPFAVGGQRAGEIGLQLLAAEGAELHAHFAVRLLLRQLADHVDHAARGTRAEQHAGRAAQHFEALQRVGVGTRGGGVPAGGIGLQAVEVDGRIAAAHREAVGADACGVGERVLQAGGALVDDLVARDHGHGLGRFGQRGVGFGGGDRVLRAVADHGTLRGLGFGIRIHPHFRQGTCIRRLCQHLMLHVNRQAPDQHRCGLAPRHETRHSCSTPKHN